ncbi:MAG: class I SAM-dependent RNA methyltransferase [Pseudomonadota bacterium]
MPLLPDAADLELFCPCPPGLEPLLADELCALEMRAVAALPGGVSARGTWGDVVRLNLSVRGATRVLIRCAEFRATHLAQLDKRLRDVDWSSFLSARYPVRASVACARSRLYHEGAVQERVLGAIASGVPGAHPIGARGSANENKNADKETGAVKGAAAGSVSRSSSTGPDADAACQTVFVRIEKNVVTVSLDTSGEPLYKRGFKTAVAKAPMRETMAALFLRACGYVPGEPVLDPMCGSGTFLLEAGDQACGLLAGRARGFAFEQVPGADPCVRAAVEAAATGGEAGLVETAVAQMAAERGASLFGRDQDPAAVRMTTANLGRAGLLPIADVAQHAVAQLRPPDALSRAGLLIVNPPYGARIGAGPGAALRATYATLGRVVKERFAGWRMAVVTSDPRLMSATRLPVASKSAALQHGGMKVALYQTETIT